jgi:hypothetical protein
MITINEDKLRDSFHDRLKNSNGVPLVSFFGDKKPAELKMIIENISLKLRQELGDWF